MKDAIESFAELVQPITEKFMTKAICYVPFKQAKDVVSFKYWSDSSKSNLFNICSTYGVLPEHIFHMFSTGQIMPLMCRLHNIFLFSDMIIG